MKVTAIIQKELFDFIEFHKLKIQEDLKRKIIINSVTQCWEWQAYRNKKGYGNHVIFTNGKTVKKTFQAHRLSYMIFKEMINDGKSLVLHDCDNPPCINPDHLHLGTNEDNMKESVKRNRIAYGERQGASILKEKDVLEIKRLYKEGKSTRQIGRMFKVNGTTIWSITSGKSWKRVKEI